MDADEVKALEEVTQMLEIEPTGCGCWPRSSFQ